MPWHYRCTGWPRKIYPLVQHKYLLNLMSKAFEFFSTKPLCIYLYSAKFPLIFSSIWQVIAIKAKRDQIVALKTDSVSWNGNVKQLKVCRKTVYNARKQSQESGTTSGKSIPGRTRTVCTKTIIFCNEEDRAKSVENLYLGLPTLVRAWALWPTQLSLGFWMSVRRSWTESGGFRDKQKWTPSSLDINPIDYAIWFYFIEGCFNWLPP